MKAVLVAFHLFLLLIAPASSVAVEAPTSRTISVTGEAAVQVVPDEVVLTLGVESRNKDLKAVKNLRDRKMNDLIAAARSAGVAQKDIRTDYFNLQPEYEHSPTNQKAFVGYVQTTTVVLTLRDTSNFEALLTAIVQAGVEYIHGIDFRTSELRKHRDEARNLAIKAANEKAVELASALNQKVGRPMSIQEGQSGWTSSYGSRWGRAGQNVSLNSLRAASDSAPIQDTALAPGMLNIRATVSATFELTQ